MNGPRFSRPSASAFPRLAACPASFRLSLDAAAQGMAPGDSKDSAHGDAVHRALATDNQSDWDALTSAQRNVAERCRDQEAELILQWARDTTGDNVVCYNPRNQTIRREKRLYMMESGMVIDDAETGEILFSGQGDGLLVRGEHGILWDYKSLPGEVEHATGNLQLMGLAVLAAGRWNLKSVRVAIVQPLAGAPTVADYDEGALRRAKQFILSLIDRVDNNPGDPNPG